MLSIWSIQLREKREEKRAQVHVLSRSPAFFFSWGAIVQWWTMFSIVMADVAAYFFGKRFGRTPLIAVSPNKTWEGLLAGCAASVAVMVRTRMNNID